MVISNTPIARKETHDFEELAIYFIVTSRDLLAARWSI